VTLGFSQWGPFVGTDRALLRVENHGEETLQLTGIGLDWPGYGGEFHQAKDATLDPGRTLDVAIDLPEPTCTETSEPVLGLVRVDAAAEVRQELDENGQAFVRQLWIEQCATQFVQERLEIEYGNRWTRYGAGSTQTIRGTLELSRRSGSETIRLLGTRGSVLYDVGLPGASTVPEDRRTADIPIEIATGNRCDEHAIGQATRPFEFWLRLRIGDAEPMTVSIPPTPRGQAETTALLKRVCRARAG